MYSDTGDTTSLVPGFPIRTSSDQSSVDSSPRHIAASHVLHRLPVPRHPPCALKHLQHKKPLNEKKLHHNKPHTRQKKNSHPAHMRLDARNHYPQIKHHTPPPRWSDNNPPTPHRGQRTNGPVASGPNSVFGSTGQQQPRTRSSLVCRAPTRHPLQAPSSISQPHHCRPHSPPRGKPITVSVLLRKEVIQPHLPVRLPCYDFVPIADPTFDGSLHKG